MEVDPNLIKGLTIAIGAIGPALGVAGDLDVERAHGAGLALAASYARTIRPTSA